MRKALHVCKAEELIHRVIFVSDDSQVGSCTDLFCVGLGNFDNDGVFENFMDCAGYFMPVSAE